MAQPAAPGLVERVSAGVLHWHLDNPARKNAVTPEALDWMARRCADLRGEVVVLLGEGDGFCAGFDLTALESPPEGHPDAPLIRATAAMRRSDATFVAAVHGYVIGAGLELASTCDLLIAARSTRFTLPAARLGVVYHAEGLAQIHARFGPLTRRLVLLGETIQASTAYDHGALDKLVDDAKLSEAVRASVAALVAGAPLSIAGNRTLLRHLDSSALPEELRRAHEHARDLAYASDDHDEARRAVAERRAPHFGES